MMRYTHDTYYISLPVIIPDPIAPTKYYSHALLDATKEVGLEVNPVKTKYMLALWCQKAGQRQSIKIANRYF
jgi:hypothetical protein